jgi:streptomycin 6-kinase
LFIIPENFTRLMTELFGEEGHAWLDRLPTLLADCEERWNLTIGAPFSNLTFNYVAPATRADGTAVIVKIGLSDEFPSQLEALRHFDGHGMVQLLAYDERNRAMLLESLRPGKSLRTVESDEVAISAAIDVIRQLWRPLPPQHYPFPTIADSTSSKCSMPSNSETSI